MSDALQVVLVIVVALVSLFALICLVRAGSRRFRMWRRYRRLPIVLASESELEAMEVDWPANKHAWPPPVDGAESRLGVEQLKAFARAARDRRRVNYYAAEVLVIIGGAALALQLPGGIDAWVKYSEHSASLGHLAYEDPFGTFTIEYQDLLAAPSVLIAFSSLALIVVALALRTKEFDYEYMERAYRTVAGRRSQQSNRGRGGRLWGSLMGRRT